MWGWGGPSSGRGEPSTRFSPHTAWEPGSPGGASPRWPAVRMSIPSSSACSPRRSSPTSTSSRRTRSRDTPRPSANRRASASAAAASCSPCCFVTHRRPTRRSGRRRRRRGGGSRGAPRRSLSPKMIWGGSAAAFRPTRWSRRFAAWAAPSCPGRPGRLERRSWSARPADVTAALGPTVPRAELGEAWSIASAALRAIEAGAIEADGLLDRGAPPARAAALRVRRGLAERLAERRLAPLDDLTPAGRTRMEETALAFVQHGGNAAAMARALHLHPQTIRYRLNRLRELFGDELNDPDARFELELALRSRSAAARG